MNTPILSLIRNFQSLILAAIVATLLTLSGSLFQHLGALLYLPALGLDAVVCAVLIAHLFFRQSLDVFIHDGSFVAAWNALDARQRLDRTLIVLVALFIGLCIVAMGLAK